MQATQPYWITKYCWQLSCSHLPWHQKEQAALSWYQCCCCWVLDKVFLIYLMSAVDPSGIGPLCRRTIPAGIVCYSVVKFYGNIFKNDKQYTHIQTSTSSEMFHWVRLQVPPWQLGDPSFVSPSHLAKVQGPLQLSVSSADTTCRPRSAFPSHVSVGSQCQVQNTKELGETPSHLVIVNNDYWASSLIHTPWLNL